MSKPWMSGFLPGETLASRELELQPLGQALGVAVYMPVIFGSPAASMEVSGISMLATTGWTEALSRLIERAKELGAHGVADIKLGKRVIDSSTSTTEFSAIGTAVRGLPRREIWTTNLPVGDLVILHRAGLVPVTLVIGCCTWHQSFYGWTPKFGKGALSAAWTNQEVRPATEALYNARAVALERMNSAATALGASGIVGVTMKFGKPSLVYPDGATAGCEAFGTAVSQIRASAFQPDLGVRMDN